MSLPAVPFEVRLLVLLVLLVLVASVDLALRGREATRWREYLVLLAFGLVGCAVGVGVDQLTSRVSPEYFVYGKGLDGGPGLSGAVVRLSLEAGLTAGLVLGSLLLVANGSPGLAPPTTLLAQSVWPVLLGVTLAPLGAATCGAVDPFGLDRFLVGLVDDPDARRRFVLVQGAHTGLYLGALVGTILAMIRVRRLARRSAPSPAAPSPSP